MVSPGVPTFLPNSSISLALVMYSSRSWAFKSLLFSNSRSAWAMDSSNCSGSELPFLTILACAETGICVKKNNKIKFLSGYIRWTCDPISVRRDRNDRVQIEARVSRTLKSVPYEYINREVDEEVKIVKTYDGDPNANEWWQKDTTAARCRSKWRMQYLWATEMVVNGLCEERGIFLTRTCQPDNLKEISVANNWCLRFTSSNRENLKTIVRNFDNQN